MGKRSVDKTNKAPLLRLSGIEGSGFKPLTAQEVESVTHAITGDAFMRDLGVRLKQKGPTRGTTKDGKAPPRIFCMKPDANGHDTLQEMDDVKRNAAFWKQVQQGNVFVYAAGERHPRQLQLQRGKDGISLSASKPLEPSEMPEPPKPPRPNWFKRTFSFLSKGWQKEIQDYNDKMAVRAADMQATQEKLTELSDACTDEALKAEADEAKEAYITDFVCDVSNRSRQQAQHGIEIMTSVYSPVPKFNKDIEKRDLKYGLYTREQFDTLKVYSKDEFDLETMTVGEANSPVTEADFAAVTMAALFTPDLARKSDSEYDPYSKSSLMQVAGLSEQEANQLTDVLDTIHCSFWTTDLFIATPRDNEGDYFKNTTNVGRQMAVDAFNAYKKGNKEPLAQLLAQGIDKGVRELMVDKMAHFLGDQELCICTMVPKMAELMDKDPQLKGIAMEKYGMTEGRFQSAKGLGMLAKAEEKRREASYRLEREAQAGDLHLTA